MKTFRVEVDLDAIQHNARLLRGVIDPDKSGACTLSPVLKQDAYGAGASRIAKRITTANDLITVQTPDEARSLIDDAIGADILVLMPVHTIDRNDATYRYAIREKLHLAAHNERQLDDIETTANTLGLSLPIHIYLDSGMGRGGARDDEATRMFRRVNASKRLRLAGVMTHFAASGSDEGHTQQQAVRFKDWLATLGATPSNNLRVHAADSAGAFRARKYHGTMVRAGQALLGYLPPDTSDFEFDAEARQLKHAVRLTSMISHVGHVPKGWNVGYGCTWTTERPSHIATVPVGYAIGYKRALANNAVVRLTGKDFHADDRQPPLRAAEPILAPVVGQISMDQITVDVTNVPPPFRRVGAEIELIATDPAAPNALPTLAASAHTIAHDFITGIGPRAPRTYVQLEPTVTRRLATPA